MKDHPLLVTGSLIPPILNDLKTHTRRIGDRYKSWKKGDRIWVREAYGLWGAMRCPCHNVCYCGDVVYKADYVGHNNTAHTIWKPSLFMPKKFARIWLEITKDVWQQRIQDITTEDIILEGLSTNLREHDAVCDLKDQFIELWDDINAKRSFSWQENPTVNVIEFKRIKP